MPGLASTLNWETFPQQAWQWTRQHVLVANMLVQAVLVVGLVLLGLFIGRALKKRLEGMFERQLTGGGLFAGLIAIFLSLLGPVFALFFIWLAVFIGRQASWPTGLLHLAGSLLAAWVVIRSASSLLGESFWTRLVALIAWSVAALSIAGILDQVTAFMDQAAVGLGSVRISLLGVVKALIILILAGRAALALTSYVNVKLAENSTVTPSAQVLIGQVIKFTLFAVIILATLAGVGINLTALAVFGGAVGVGLGFGLQKVVSNLVSGFILLLDRSIKPGDVIQIGEEFGWINSIKSRYTSLITRDGHEFLIPNEQLITSQVINWSYTDRNIRLRLPIGVSYGSDPHRVIDLVLKAASEIERVLKDPVPVCWLVGYGDSSVDFELRVWINDPENGLTNVKGMLYLKIWDTFKEHGIEIPFPQRDVHVKTLPKGAQLEIKPRE